MSKKKHNNKHILKYVYYCIEKKKKKHIKGAFVQIVFLFSIKIIDACKTASIITRILSIVVIDSSMVSVCRIADRGLIFILRLQQDGMGY